MKYVILALIFGCCTITASAQIQGRILSAETSEPMAGATVRLASSGDGAVSDVEGRFSMPSPTTADTLVIRFIGYDVAYYPVNPGMTETLEILLNRQASAIEEVEINTGFYQVPRERATGSFTHVDNETLNRVVGGNILQRLEGIASGVQFTNANGTSPGDIRVRGLATIESNEEPLIVVDNFPYEGSIDRINPNDVESITILKDAAAASIWGARAGNGVIVITTKQGHYGQRTRISLNSNVTIGEKPDLFYAQNQLPSEVVMQIEKAKFDYGGYYLGTAQQTSFPQYVELLIKRRDGLISENDFIELENILKNTDVRSEALKHLYQHPIYQQYALNVRGGSDHHSYYFSGGYDRGKSEIIGNGNSRMNLNLQNTFRPMPGMDVTAGLWYTQQRGGNDGFGLSDLASPASQVGLSPYTRLKDGNGKNLPIVKNYRQAYVDVAEENGLLDWQYRPLDEIAFANNRTRSAEIRVNGGLRYNFLQFFNANLTYQYIKVNNESSRSHHENSYFVRDMVNRFTQPDGTKVIPHSGIFQGGSPAESVSHSGRSQINYGRSFGLDHAVSALAGGEIRSRVVDGYPGYTLYNFDHDLLTGTQYMDYTVNYHVNPTGRARIPQPPNTRSRLTDRNLSYFGNASYIFKDRYIISGSLRWDGSNLFGVKTNQKGTPLWSIGGSWRIVDERFSKSNYLSNLRLRATFGSSGNVNKNVSVYPTIYYWGIDWLSGLTNASLTSAGNPSLRWEQVKTLNLAIDFSSRNKRISGGLEFYIKQAEDLIGADYLPPSTGIITGGTASATNLINYANLRTQGWDMHVSTLNISGELKWSTTWLFNFIRNRITHFNTGEQTTFSAWFSGMPPPVVGRSRDVMYALPWRGLNPQNGYPIVYLDGEQSQDYQTYYNTRTIDDLMVAGVRIPPFYGSLQNMLEWRGLSLDVLLAWKAGHVFRRSSMSSGSEFSAAYHQDYFKRWKQPGDELYTNVPAEREIGETVPLAGPIYTDSEALITRGDHIRLQDIRLAYTLSPRISRRLQVSQVRVFAYARNMGLIWKANRNGIDPDYLSGYPAIKTLALGAQLDL